MPVTPWETVTEQVAFLPLPSLAVQVMVQVPLLTAVTKPFWLTVATSALLLFQVTPLLDALEGRIVAVSWEVVPILFRERVDWLSVIPVTNWVTVTAQEADAPPPSLAVHVMVQDPRLTAVTSPSAFTVATLSSLLCQMTSVIKALAGVTVALSWEVEPDFMESEVWFSVILVTTFAELV